MKKITITFDNGTYAVKSEGIAHSYEAIGIIEIALMVKKRELMESYCKGDFPEPESDNTPILNEIKPE